MQKEFARIQKKVENLEDSHSNLGHVLEDRMASHNRAIDELSLALEKKFTTLLEKRIKKISFITI